MEQIVVKTEMQPNGEILLYYVDENDAGSAVSIENQLLQMGEGGDYEIQELPMEHATAESINWVPVEEYEPATKDKWTDDDVKKLLTFYVDNKDAFSSGSTKKKHLWSVACKTMIIGKTPQACDVKLRNLKRKYSSMILTHQNGVPITWHLFELAHRAFYDDTQVQFMLRGQTEEEQEQKINIPIIQPTEEDNAGVIPVKNVNRKTTEDPKITTMLNIYLRKKNFYKDNTRRGLWEMIAVELGEEDADYWQKRFMNFKQHYLRMVAKRDLEGAGSVNWPYMELFDQIFKDDPEFQKKHAGGNKSQEVTKSIPNETPPVLVQFNDWNDTELMILVKYCFDCFDDFQDSTIPDNFLWNEVGRLLDKKPDDCKQKYEELKQAHLLKYIQGGYTLRGRPPLAILFDNIISKEVEIELSTDKQKRGEVWQTDEMDELVQFLYENMEMFKDPVCYYVCWSSVASKLEKSVSACKKQWENLKRLYKSILDDKKENPDLQIDWRYIELFDRIFDYGMDTNMLMEFKQHKDQNSKPASNKIAVKKVIIKAEDEPVDISDEEEYDERGFTKRTKRDVGESKWRAFQILEFYQKNKDKFTAQRNKQSLWRTLAQQIGLTEEQCAHRFRNYKQIYHTFVQREIDKPDMPILWPYYALCKKVFGYRAIKSKLKSSKIDNEITEEWVPKEIKQIINFFGTNFAEINNDEDNDSSKWAVLANAMGKSVKSVNNKFLELRRSYLKLKSMKENNPDCKVSWKYYNLFDVIYTKEGMDGTEMEVEELDFDDSMTYEEEVTDDNMKTDVQDEDDYQCIIVIPEGQDISEISNAQIIIESESQEIPAEEIQAEVMEKRDIKTEVMQTEKLPKRLKWPKKQKKKLLILYLKYIRSMRGKCIDPVEMWAEISSKFTEKSAKSCRYMMAVLKKKYIELASKDEETKKKSPYYSLLRKIMRIKPKFGDDSKKFRDVLLPTAKVQLALQYYLQHIEDFHSPKYEKKYLWTELGEFVSESVNKLFNKINYLKQYYNVETDEVKGEKTLFGDLLKEIVTKENHIRSTVPAKQELSGVEETVWSDEEAEQLLVWYLANLEKFKNPKYVRKYLWTEATEILGKSPLACSKKMIEIRTQYKTMIKENPDGLNVWRFYDLCQKIYGTGKKSDDT